MSAVVLVAGVVEVDMVLVDDWVGGRAPVLADCHGVKGLLATFL